MNVDYALAVKNIDHHHELLVELILPSLLEFGRTSNAFNRYSDFWSLNYISRVSFLHRLLQKKSDLGLKLYHRPAITNTTYLLEQPENKTCVNELYRYFCKCLDLHE